ncbi:MAG: glycosyltransferase family 39 protein [bacterium]|nr:glycosyltransferase family 39 protein [bacterium]
MAGIACLVVLVLLSFLFLRVAGNRLFFPYNVEWMEGTVFADSLRIWEGLPLYVDPESGWAALVYNPLYQYLVALLIPFAGPGIGTARALSLVSTLLTAMCIYATVRRSTRSPAAGVTGAALFLASFPVVGYWYDLARIDSFWIFTMLLGCALVGGGAPSPPRVALPAMLFAVSFFTKQHAAAAAGCVFLYLLATDRRRAVAFAGLTGILIGGGILFLQWHTGGWYWHYAFGQTTGHVSRGMTYPILTGYGIHMGMSYIFRYYPVCLVAVVFLAARGRLRLAGGSSAALWVLLFVVFLAMDGLNYAKSRSWHNSFYPTIAFTSVIVGILAGVLDAERRARPLRSLLFSTCLLAQGFMLAYDPADHVPREEDLAAGNGFIAFLSGLPGEVWVPHHPDYAHMAGKGFHYTSEGTERYYKMTGRLIRRMIEDVENRRYDRIIIDADLDNGFTAMYSIPELRDALRAHYVEKRIFDYGGLTFPRRPDHRQDWLLTPSRPVFVPVEGSQFRPHAVLVPRGRPAEAAGGGRGGP